MAALSDALGSLFVIATDDDVRELAAPIPPERLAVLAIKIEATDRIASAFGRTVAMQVRAETLRVLAELAVTRARVFTGPAGNGAVFIDTGLIDPEIVRRDIARRLTSTITVDDNDYFVQTHLGVALPGDVESDDPNDLLQAAIAATFAAITNGTHIGYASEVSEKALRDDVRLAAELANSAAEAFSLHYQPIVDLETLATVGFESLLRWTVDGRVRLPGEFLDAAEETSLIVPIGRRGVAEAISQLARWRTSNPDRDLFMSANFSSQQLFDRDLPAHVHSCLESAGVPARALWVEVTERDLISPDSLAAQTIRELDALGCIVCIDDLGTGYAALRYMLDQPIKVAKIDRSLVCGIDTDDTQRRIVETVCRLSEKLHISTVAEGVECDQQVSLLREVGFTHGQGFLFGKPLAADEVVL